MTYEGENKNDLIKYRCVLPTTAGISPNGCEGAECHDLKSARLVV